MKILKRSITLTIGIWLIVLLAACQTGASTGNNQPYQPSENAPSSQPGQASGQGNTSNQGNPAPSGSGSNDGPFQVTRIDLSVSPTSMAGMNCGVVVNTLTYTAVFNFPDHTRGGTLKFSTIFRDASNTTIDHSESIDPGTVTYTYTFKVPLYLTNGRHPLGVSISVSDPNSGVSGHALPDG